MKVLVIGGGGREKRGNLVGHGKGFSMASCSTMG